MSGPRNLELERKGGLIDLGESSSNSATHSQQEKAFLPDSGILLLDTVTSFDLHFRYVISVLACEAVNTE